VLFVELVCINIDLGDFLIPYDGEIYTHMYSVAIARKVHTMVVPSYSMHL
jgi:hypothetical protein